jgi:hypothetical protein
MFSLITRVWTLSTTQVSSFVNGMPVSNTSDVFVYSQFYQIFECSVENPAGYPVSGLHRISGIRVLDLPDIRCFTGQKQQNYYKRV